MKNKVFAIVTLVGMLCAVGGFVGFTVYVDPFFHYHAPSKGIEYPLFSERYMNDGITRHFEYDSIITGTSMTENFNASLWDEIHQTKSIKVPSAGASYKEIDSLLRNAYKYHDGEINIVLRGLDLTMIATDKDDFNYDDYPEYLYDDNIFNDVHYVLNKEIFFDYTCYVFEFMAQGGKMTTFDAYKNWHGLYPYDANKLREEYQRRELAEEQKMMTTEDANRIRENVQQNVVELICAHPETDFYLFLPPYSILYWDDIVRTGCFQWNLDAQRIMIEMLLPLENVHLYSFFDDYIMICDLSNYIDSCHYGQDYSNMIMNNMRDGIGLLTRENYEQYFLMLQFYNLFDYESFYNS